MSEDSKLPLQGIADDVIQHLRFLQTLRVTHLGGSAAPLAEAPAAATETIPETPLPTPERVELQKVEPPPALPVQADVPPAPMPQISLFDTTPPPPETPADTCLADIRADIGDCQRCKLAPTRTNLVFGDGNPAAQLVFVGEGPGADEDETGIPFVGKAGQLLNKIIEAIGMKREDVYICNVVKCRPPNNRTPEKDEVAACNGFLHRQLAIIRPKIIVALGATPAFTLLADNKIGSITRIRGTFFDYRGTPLMPTFHPAYLLRSPDKKREVWEDMKKVRDFLKN
jgi:DNA polymerase